MVLDKNGLINESTIEIYGQQTGERILTAAEKTETIDYMETKDFSTSTFMLMTVTVKRQVGFLFYFIYGGTSDAAYLHHSRVSTATIFYGWIMTEASASVYHSYPQGYVRLLIF